MILNELMPLNPRLDLATKQGEKRLSDPVSPSSRVVSPSFREPYTVRHSAATYLRIPATPIPRIYLDIIENASYAAMAGGASASPVLTHSVRWYKIFSSPTISITTPALWATPIARHVSEVDKTTIAPKVPMLDGSVAYRPSRAPSICAQKVDVSMRRYELSNSESWPQSGVILSLYNWTSSSAEL
jgi:hypothetical protein